MTAIIGVPLCAMVMFALVFYFIAGDNSGLGGGGGCAS